MLSLTNRTTPLFQNDPALEIYIAPMEESPWPSINSGSTDVSGDTSSRVSLRKGMDWIRLCTETHNHSNINTRSRLPRRVLYISTRTIRVSESKGSIGIYGCLSHCWGVKPIIRALKSNIKKLKKEVHWNSLPKTFQNTISVLKQLRIQYLWSDSLCNNMNLIAMLRITKLEYLSIYPP